MKILLKIIFKFLFFLFFFISGQNLYALEFKVLELNHAQKNKLIVYNVRVDNCKIIKDSFKLNAQNGILTFFDQIYYDFEIQDQNDNEIIFKLKSAKNFEFHYIIKKNTCTGVLYVNKDQELSPIKMVEIDYRNALGFPTVKTMHMFLSDSPSPISVDANKLEGYTPFYEVGLGMALNIHSNIRRNERRRFNRWDPVVEPLPTFMLRYGPLFANRDGFGMVLVPLKNFALLTTFLLEGEPYKADFVRARKRSLYFGPLLKINLLEVLYYKDIRSISNGTVLKISLAPEFKISQYWTINPRVYYQYWDYKYVDYYFNVSDEEARSLKTQTFHGDEADNYGFAINNIYKLDKCDFILSFGHKFYDKSVSNSPLVTRDNEMRIISGFIYKFL